MAFVTPGNFLVAVIAGLCGMVAMELVMWLITRRGWAEGNMVIALGSLLTRKRDNAFFTGGIIHVIAAIFFAMIYVYAMLEFGFIHFPSALTAGIGFGMLHGLVVTLALVWVISDQHPLEEFRDAGLAVGVSHIAGHIAYGAVVGLIVGLMLG